MKIVARIYNDFKTKFAVPRQSGLSGNLESKIIFEKDFRDPDFVQGIENFSHLWLIWGFSENKGETKSPKVRPPRLGGNTSVGVFATRSPYRPNPIGLSSVKLIRTEISDTLGTVLYVTGADMVNNTPIYDIKPYLAYTDSHPDAKGGFADEFANYKLEVIFPQDLLKKIPVEKQDALIKILSQDPRPSYQNDEERSYGFLFSEFEIRFVVKDKILTVINVELNT